MPVSDFVGTTDLDDYQAGDPATIVLQVQSAIRSYCGWHVAPEVEGDIFYTEAGRIYQRHLWLPSLKVAEITSVVDEGTTLTAEEYDWSDTGYLERRSGYWSTRPRQIFVTYTHGYAEIPADIVGIAVAVADRSINAPGGIVRQSTGPFSVERLKAALLEDEKSVLDKYRLPPRP
jgi:hypothetical protein